MKVLLVTATETEAAIIRKFAVPEGIADKFRVGDISLDLLVTGVGTVATAWSLTRWFYPATRPDLAINAGIAGSFREEIKVGDVVMPVTDCFADSGVETAEGFMSLSEAGLQDPHMFPFTDGRIIATNRFIEMTAPEIRPVTAVTVNTATGTRITTEKLITKYDPDIETMEGAAFFYVCSQEKVPFIAFRAISNKVGVRDHKNWNIRLALRNLTVVLEDFLTTLDRKK